MIFYIWLYRLISVALLPFLALWMLVRLKQKKEDLGRIGERFGIANLAVWREFIRSAKSDEKERLKETRLWIHAVSVGEANSAWILAKKLLESSPKIKVIFTTTTLTSSTIISKKICSLNLQSEGSNANRIIHQFLPLDSFFIIEKFFGLWQPSACLLVESEIWPNVIFCAKSKRIPVFLINARISAKSARNWLFARRIGFGIFDYFSAIFAQTKSDQIRLQKLTKNSVLCYGNLKSEAEKLDYDEAKLQQLQDEISGRKILLCASTHEGEEEELLKIHQRLRLEFQDLLTILVLRHPPRSLEVADLIKDFKFAVRSKNQAISAETEIYLVDSLGELGIFYHLADFAFIGGSIAAVGGHNPFEAIALNCAVISGKEVFNFAEIYDELAKKNAAFIAQNSEEIYEKLREFLSDKTKAKAMAEAARQELNLSQDIAEKIIRKIEGNFGSLSDAT